MHYFTITWLTFSPDGKKIASASLDETIKIWDVETKQCINTIKDKEARKFYSVVFSPDGEWIVTGSWDNKVRIYDINSGKV